MENLGIPTADKSGRASGRTLSKRGKIILGVFGASFVGVVAVTTPFVWPAVRKICLPYVPATSHQVDNVMQLLAGASRRGRLIDLGSGDGRIVIEAAKRGFRAEGVELNPWLVWYSRLRSVKAGVNSNTRFYTKNLWKTDLSRYDRVVVFGVDSMMEPLENKLKQELRDDSQMGRFRLVTFDVTKTILKVIGSPAHHYCKAARDFGVNIPEPDVTIVYQSTWAKMKEDHPNYGIQQGFSREEWWAEFVKRVFLNAGYDGKLKTLYKVSEHLWSQFSEGDNWEIIPNSREVLEELRKHNATHHNSNMKLGVISNFDERLEKTLEKYELRHYFDFLVSPIEAQVDKPDPYIFHMALHLAGVKAEQSVHVGDDIVDDYWGAQKAGFTPVLIDRGGKLRKTTPDQLEGVDPECVIEDIKELPALLLKNFK